MGPFALRWAVLLGADGARQDCRAEVQHQLYELVRGGALGVWGVP